MRDVIKAQGRRWLVTIDSPARIVNGIREAYDGRSIYWLFTPRRVCKPVRNWSSKDGGHLRDLDVLYRRKGSMGY